MATFPGGTHTFSVRRDQGLITDPQHPQNQIDGGPAVVLTGVSVQMKPLLGLQMVTDAAVENMGKFNALTFSGTDIRNNDILLDEQHNGADTKPVAYTVDLVYDNNYYLQMFVRINAIGG